MSASLQDLFNRVSCYNTRPHCIAEPSWFFVITAWIDFGSHYAISHSLVPRLEAEARDERRL